jgi:hypothetical protein
MAKEEADQRMANDRFAVAMLDERMPAVTCVFHPPVARCHYVDVMSKQTAEIPHALVEASARVVRIRAERKEERMATADARVLGVAIAHADPFVRVVPEEARQRVPDADDAVVVAQARSCATCAGAPVVAVDPVVNGVTPDMAEHSTEHQHLLPYKVHSAEKPAHARNRKQTGLRGV